MTNKKTIIENLLTKIEDFKKSNDDDVIKNDELLKEATETFRRNLIIYYESVEKTTARKFARSIGVNEVTFLNIVNPFMEQVQANSGLTAFRVVMDSTNNTPDLIDQNILYGQVFLQPTRTAEFIVLDFKIFTNQILNKFCLILIYESLLD